MKLASVMHATRANRWNRRLLSRFNAKRGGESVTIDNLGEDEAICLYRFRKEHLRELADALWPRIQPHVEGTREKLKGRNHVFEFDTGLLVFLLRLSYPRRLRDIERSYFHIKKSKLSAIILTMLDALYEVAKPYLSSPQLWSHRMEYYSKSLVDKGAPIGGIWAFIDGTLRKTARPVRYQKRVYSGHKRAHGLKFQNISAPDGMIIELYGPVCGNRHDSFMLNDSNLLQRLEECFPLEDGKVYSLYGDPAYPESMFLVVGWKNAPPRSARARFNKLFSKLRISVEWAFKDISKLRKFLDFKHYM